jgi:uncharacterized protein YfaS (alpha-2-macroglobulin family)
MSTSYLTDIGTTARFGRARLFWLIAFALMVACVSSSGPPADEQQTAGAWSARGSEGLPDDTVFESPKTRDWKRPTIEVSPHRTTMKKRGVDRSEESELDPISSTEKTSVFEDMPALPPVDGTPAFEPTGDVAPPDRANTTTQATFPPEDQSTRPENAPEETSLRVETIRVRKKQGRRIVAIRFSRPMIEVGAVDDVGAGKVPAEITPGPPGGTWSWKSPRLLVFEATEGELVGGTNYAVAVPGGTTAVDGAALEAPASERFEPEPLKVTQARLGEIRGTGGGPEGAVVTFSRPMVESIDEDRTRALEEAVELDPNIEGSWRWTRRDALTFRPTAGHFPKGAIYELSFPAGLTSVAGGKLDGEETWQLETEPPKWAAVWPDTTVTRERRPYLFMAFNHRVRREVVDEHLTVEWRRPTDDERRQLHRFAPRESRRGFWNVGRYGGDSSHPEWHTIDASRLEVLDGSALEEVLSANSSDIPDTVREWVSGEPPKSWIMYRFPGELPSGARVRTKLSPGPFSTGGSLEARKTRSARFHVYPEFRASGVRCGADDRTTPWSKGLELSGSDRYDGGPPTCRPYEEVVVRFSTAVDPSTLEAADIRTDPNWTIEKVRVEGREVGLQGVKPGRGQTLELTFEGEVRDVHGQRLEGDRTVTFEGTSTRTAFDFPREDFLVLDPYREPEIPVYTGNYTALDVRYYRVSPADYRYWKQNYLETLRGQNSRHTGLGWPPPPGEQIHRERVEIDARENELVESHIPLEEALGEDGGGNLVVIAEPADAREGFAVPKRPNRPVFRSWVQVTNTAVDVFHDGDEVVAWVTRLRDGRPVSGAEVSFGNDATSRTGPDGFARLEKPTREAVDVSAARSHLTVSTDKGRVFVPEPLHRDSKKTPTSTRWFLFDDRGLYRPGEPIRVAGWIREIRKSEEGKLQIPDPGTTLNWKAVGPRGDELASGEVETTELGGVDIGFSLSEEVDLGEGMIHFWQPREFEDEYRRRRHRRQLQRMRSRGKDPSIEQFTILEFRRPKFEVTANFDDTTYVRTEAGNVPAEVHADARYFSGGPLSGAEVDWQVTSEAGLYAPPGHSEYTFDARKVEKPTNDQPLGAGNIGQVAVGKPTSEGEESSDGVTTTGTVGRSGRHRLAVRLSGVAEGRPTSIRAKADVSTTTRQAGSDEARTLVHPAAHYVGLRTQHATTQTNEPLRIESVVADIDGQRQARRPVEVVLSRLVQQDTGGGLDRPSATDPGRSSHTWHRRATCERTTDAKGRATCTFEPTDAGIYQIRATTVDGRGREHTATVVREVRGREDSNKNQLRVEPNRDSYRAGETAELLVRSPIAPAHGVLVVDRYGVAATHYFAIDEHVERIELPVEASYAPDVRVTARVVGAEAASEGNDAPKDSNGTTRPAEASTTFNLSVSPDVHRLSVEVSPTREAVAPGAKTSAVVSVRDSSDQPVEGAEVALAVVDTSVLAEDDYELPDPIGAFFPPRQLSGGSNSHSPIGSEQSRRFIPTSLTTKSDWPTLQRSSNFGGRRRNGGLRPVQTQRKGAGQRKRLSVGPGGGARGARKMGGRAENKTGLDSLDTGEVGEDSDGPTLRTDLSPLAAFEPNLKTDDDGQVETELELPDNITRYRLMAVAVTDDEFGKGSGSMEARRKLTIRPTFPRFLNLGDRATLPVVVQNQSETVAEAVVAMRTRNLEMTGIGGTRLHLAPNARKKVEFPVTTRDVGEAHIQVAVRSEVGGDAVRKTIPVLEPAASESFASYGTIDKGTKALAIQKPQEARSDSGGLEVTTSSTALHELTDAFLHLYEYEYTCSEQIASRLTTTVTLWDALKEFDLEGMPASNEVEASMNTALRKLERRQTADGGFRLWPDSDAYPFVSVHAAHALHLAAEQGYDVDEEVRKSVTRRLRQILTSAEGVFPEERVRRWERRTVRAYAAFVLHELGHTGAAARGVESLLATADGLEALPLDVLGWFWIVLDAADASHTRNARRVGAYIEDRIEENASRARVEPSSSGRSSYRVFYHPQRLDAVVLRAMMEARPDSPLVPKLVRGLLQERERGRWSNTQTNAWVLLALNAYFRQYEATPPDFEARMWLGESFAGHHRFEGRSAERFRTRIPMDFVSEQTGQEGRTNLFLQKKGNGRMYYRVAMDYVPEDVQLSARDRGFSVERSFELMGSSGAIEKREGGGLVVEAGARLRVKIDVSAPDERHHVALVDPLPAGFTSVDGSGEASSRYEATGGNYFFLPPARPWHDHVNMREDQTEVFSVSMAPGEETYAYTIRATTPGTYVVPPARAEEMYHSEVFGRGASTTITVVD